MSDLILPDVLCDRQLLSAFGLSGSAGRHVRLPRMTVGLRDRYHLPAFMVHDGENSAGQVFSGDPEAIRAVSCILRSAGVTLQHRDVDGQAALVAMIGDGAAFDPVDWTARMIPVWCTAAAEIESLSDRFAPEEIGTRLQMILSRAHSRNMAAAEIGDGGFGRSDVSVASRTSPYVEYFAVDEYRLRHSSYAGGQSQELRRAVFLAADAVTVLPYDPQRDRVLLVEQFRAGPFARGDARAWVLEPVAGRIEPGDTPEETAHKEAFEEAGLTLDALHSVGGYYPSTGCFSEYLLSYVGLCDLPDTASGLYGLASEGEDIRAILMPRAELIARLQRNEIPDGPLILTAYWLELNRERLVGG